MCGITAFCGEAPPNKDLLKLLMLHNSLERGKDSTGVYTPSKGIMKDNISTIDYLIKYNPFTKDNTFIAHARAATIGSITKENAHPFKYGDTVMVHNGTLRYMYYFLNKMGKTFNDFSVDSQALCYAINKYKEIDFLEDVDGAIALVWTNLNTPNTLYVYRNYERPLFYGYIDKNMYISSIKESLEIIDCQKIDSFDTGFLYTIICGKLTKKKLKKTYYTPKTKTIRFNNANIDAIDVLDLIGRWVKARVDVRPNGGHTPVVRHDNWYYVDSVKRGVDYAVVVKDDDNNLCSLSKHGIDFTDFEIRKNDYLVLMSNMKYANNKIFASKNDLLLCTEVFLDNTVNVTNIKTNKTSNLSYSYVRKLEDEDLDALLEIEQKEILEEKIMKEKVNNSLDKINDLLEKIKEKQKNKEDISIQLAAIEMIVDDIYFEDIKLEKENAH